MRHSSGTRPRQWTNSPRGCTISCMRSHWSLVVAIVAAACAPRFGAAPSGETDWRLTGGDPTNDRYSPLSQINRDNVRQLQVAWVYNGGDTSGVKQIQATPIVVHGVLYSTGSSGRAFALRASTG